MAKDPAFLFYPADASEDTQFLNRLERGCYFDLLKAQKKHRRFSIELIRKVLGRDFDTCWFAIEPVMKKDEGGYFIEWVEEAIEKRAVYSAKQKERIAKYWEKKRAEEETSINNGYTTEQPDQYQCDSFEDEIANGDGIGIGYRKESKLEVFEKMFADEKFVEQIKITHHGKNIKQAFEECYTHHSNAPNPPEHLWQWKQKLNTWLTNMKYDKPSKNAKQSSRDLAEALQQRMREDASVRQP